LPGHVGRLCKRQLLFSLFERALHPIGAGQRDVRRRVCRRESRRLFQQLSGLVYFSGVEIRGAEGEEHLGRLDAAAHHGLELANTGVALVEIDQRAAQIEARLREGCIRLERLTIEID
jgi:hypothetical protein